jgi:hypothetical protein
MLSGSRSEDSVVRLADLPEVGSRHRLAKVCAPFDTHPFAQGPPLCERRVALITAAVCTGRARTPSRWSISATA